MRTLHDTVLEAIAAAMHKRPTNSRNIKRLTKRAIQETTQELVEAVEKSLRRRAPKMLVEHRSLEAGFRARNIRRWRKALDLLQTQLVIADEVVEEFDTVHRAEAAKSQNFQFEALAHLCSRALLITREVVCLVEGGYADGALSRWRSLHEAAVFAQFLLKHDVTAAERYLANFHCEAYRAANQMNRFAKRANLKPFSAAELKNMKIIRDNLMKRLGAGIGEENGWAGIALGKPHNKARTTIGEIEESVSLDHWRPRYKWASQHTHANHRPATTFLGMVESKDYMLLSGASNSGMVDPLQMTAISLTICVSALLSTKPNVDTIVALKILSSFSSEIGPVAMNIERDSFRWAKARQGSKIKSPKKPTSTRTPQAPLSTR